MPLFNPAGAVSGDNTVTNGNIVAATAGKGIQVKEGSNAKMGTAVLNGITEVTISTTAISATSRVFLCVESPAGTVGGLAYVSSRIAGTSFGIKSLTIGDTSTVAWLIIDPAP